MLQPSSRAFGQFEFAVVCSRGLRLNVEPLGGQGGSMVPLSQIHNPEVRELADEALRFLESHSWCGPVKSGELAFAVAGVVGIFKFSVEPSYPDVDSLLWVITGDLPPAYLGTDRAHDWQSALARYVDEMRK